MSNTEIIAFTDKAETRVLIEVSKTGGSRGPQPARKGQAPSIREADMGLEEALETAIPASSMLVRALDRLSKSPDEVSVEFGIDIYAELGAVVARVGGKAGFKVRLTWKGRWSSDEQPHT